MEVNKNDINSSIYFNNLSVVRESVKKNACSDYFFNPSEILQDSKNLILVLSIDGKPQKFSKSLYSTLGYSDDELINSHANNLLIIGEFVLVNNSTTYYFDSVIKCKGGINKQITWRLIPNLLIDQFVFIGWEM